ncbi:MAG: SpoIIE family protein phosphatase [Candidatus Latescibacteria bacterium]|nr:SpoIIE family protein phosphatase [Candidatus Latescibacterota bacterium]NIM21468.1 SpoIIE family protein phosphatase [Candidatus Latescibacterota bacterium]NIM65639.1 SpoIIE family protein phosphatase [Candidatus Latescibacterota bacterium]NIO02021.1 SpoIIE family protein phosphatase [Candidatus Latescibacterota bacterium]NIO28833.1 SpoIIE family protein phosphatase [Candidatus Latescibacterota bacterium]
MKYNLRSGWHVLLATAILVGVYYVMARLGQVFAIPPGNVTAVWFPSGIALAAVLLFGYRLWPGILIGSLLANTWAFFDPTSTATLIKSLMVGSLIGAGATLEAVAAAFLLHRLIGLDDLFLKAKNIFKFAVFPAALSSVIAATLGVASLSSYGIISWGSYASTWTTWWLGDTTGILVTTPVLIAWCQRSKPGWDRRQVAEILILLLLLIAAGQFFLGSWYTDAGLGLPLAYISIPLLMWPAVRFSQREAATVIFFLAVEAVWGCAKGYGPFAGEGNSEGILSLQGFVGVIAVATLSLAADVAHRKRIEKGLHKYKKASRQTADHWMITDLNGVVLEVNPSFEKISGYSEQELIGKKSNILKSGKHDAAFYKDMWNMILSGQPYRGVVINKKKNGDLFYEAKTISPIRNERGEITHFLSSGKDITDLKLTEEKLFKTAQELQKTNVRLLESKEALVQQTKILKSVFNGMSEGVIVADERGQFLMFNAAAEEMVGVGATETDPGEWASRYGVFLPDCETPYPTKELPLVRAIHGKNTDEVEMFIRNPKKPEGAWLSVGGQALRDEKGNLAGGVIITRDITQRKRAEETERQLKANREELDIARKIQQKLFPNAAPTVAGIDIGGASRPAVATGGDYFDYLQMPDGKLVFVVGDASGHGFGPALLMASARAYIHALARSNLDIAEILRITNLLIANDTGAEDFVTLILARFDPETRSFEYASAGHTTCYLLDRENAVKATLESTGLPLGVLEDARFERTSTRILDPGDLIVLLTDGVIEAESSDGASFGVEHALAIVRTNRDKCAAEIVEALHTEVTKHCANVFQDDITAIVIKTDSSQHNEKLMWRDLHQERDSGRIRSFQKPRASTSLFDSGHATPPSESEV